MNWLLANDYGRLRGLEVVRGWIVISILLTLLAGIAVALWNMGLGATGLLGGLLVLTIIVIAYSVTSGR